MLVFETSGWAQSLWQSHLTHSRPARRLVAAGQRKQARYPEFADDVHGALYLRQRLAPRPEAPRWAVDLLTQAQDLPEWKILKARCLQSGFAAGVGTEALLRELAGCIPDEADEDAEPPEEGATGAMRQQFRQAMRAAGKEIDSAQASMEGLGGLEGGTGGTVQPESLVAVAQMQALYARLRDNDAMQLMAQLAGRFERLVAARKTTQAMSQVGAITGVGIGGALPRLLPSELAGLRGPRLLRLMTLSKIQGRRALQYDVRGPETRARGPIVFLADKSGSMGKEEVAWEAAVGLMLAKTCAREGRVFATINFDDTLHDEMIVEPGAGVPLALCTALCHHTAGGTDFEKPLARAVALLRTQAVLTDADVILATDGEPNDGLEPTAETLAALQQLRDTQGLSIYGIGIGSGARLETIQAVATETYHLRGDVRQESGKLVPLLARVS